MKKEKTKQNPKQTPLKKANLLGLFTRTKQKAKEKSMLLCNFLSTR